LQAGAARELLDRDPQFVRRALQAIEETGRAAMDDLDYVLGALREHQTGQEQGPGQPDPRPGTPIQRAPQRTLADLDRLVADTRGTGLPVTVEVEGALAALPAALSREGYRIVQEGLTNAARHAGRQPVTLRMGVRDGKLHLDLVNPVAQWSTVTGPASAGPSQRGRGLAGMRERVALLGGQMTAGRDGDRWRVSVQLPIDSSVGSTGGENVT
ncbi:MAG TPA: histidine kinase, partial [Micromonosporaceae bacterium]|nr:histidine kinase [Micromonosporaceae bacterium]